MKYIKTFEDLKNEFPEVGDYVMIKTDTHNDGYDDFINNEILTVVSFNFNDNYNDYVVKLKCDKIPSKFKYYFDENNEILYFAKLIVAFAKTKEELEQKLTANKFNL